MGHPAPFWLVFGGRVDMVDDVDGDGAGLFDEFEAGLDFEGFGESLAWAVNAFKANSSRFMHEQGFEFQWQNGYGAFSVSPSHLDKVTAYVRRQREHHTMMTYEQEFLTLLKKAGVPYDPRYVLG